MKVHQVRNEILVEVLPAGMQETAREELIFTIEPGPMSKVTAGKPAASMVLPEFCGDPKTLFLPPLHSFISYGLFLKRREAYLLGRNHVSRLDSSSVYKVGAWCVHARVRAHTLP